MGWRVGNGTRGRIGSPSPGFGLRFPGDPGVGKAIVGANHNSANGYPISWFDTRIFPSGNKIHSAVRTYNNEDMAWDASKKNLLTGWINKGIIPFMSFKNGGSPAGSRTTTQILAGAGDSDLNGIGNYISAINGFIWKTYYHEPEPNHPVGAGADHSDEYRQVFRYIVKYLWDNFPGTRDKIAWMSPFYTQGTFTGGAVGAAGNNRDWREWHPNWSGSAWLTNGPLTTVDANGVTRTGSYVHLDGIDLYMPTTAGNIDGTSRNPTWTEAVTERFLQTRIDHGAWPLCWTIGELGQYDYLATLDDNGVTVTDVLTSLRTTGIASQGLVGACAWNAANSRFDDANDPTGEKVASWKTLVGTSSVNVLPS